MLLKIALAVAQSKEWTSPNTVTNSLEEVRQLVGEGPLKIPSCKNL
jgi:hypothetical protein